MSNFRHLDGMHNLLIELHEVNDRVMCGDYTSPQAAINSTAVKKIMLHYHEALMEDGADNVNLSLYVAAGGWVGISWSYTVDGFEVGGSQTPRRIA